MLKFTGLQRVGHDLVTEQQEYAKRGNFKSIDKWCNSPGDGLSLTELLSYVKLKLKWIIGENILKQLKNQKISLYNL